METVDDPPFLSALMDFCTTCMVLHGDVPAGMRPLFFGVFWWLFARRRVEFAPLLWDVLCIIWLQWSQAGWLEMRLLPFCVPNSWVFRYEVELRLLSMPQGGFRQRW